MEKISWDIKGLRRGHSDVWGGGGCVNLRDGLYKDGGKKDVGWFTKDGNGRGKLNTGHKGRIMIDG